MWIILALLSGLAFAGVMLVNQQVRLEGKVIMLWRGVVLTGLLLPVALLMDWPREPTFYLWCIICGLIVGVHDFILFNTAREHGAGVTSRTLPMGILVSFSLWLAIDADQRQALLAEPLKAAGIAACLLGVVICMWFARRNKVNAAAFKMLAPAILLTALIDVTNKMAMSSGAGHESVGLMDRTIVYSLLVSFGSGVVTLGQLAFDANRKALLQKAVSPEARKGGFILLGMMALAMFSKAPAMALADNPAYVAALVLTGAIWVILFNRWRKVEDRSSIKAGLAFLACVAALVILKG